MHWHAIGVWSKNWGWLVLEGYALGLIAWSMMLTRRARANWKESKQFLDSAKALYKQAEQRTQKPTWLT